MAEPVQLYICYAEENKNALFRLEKQLTALIKTDKIQLWHRNKLMGGDYRDQHITTQLDRTRIILMLVSADLFGEYYNSYEVQHAFQLYKEPEEQEVRLIPIIVGYYNWQEDQTLGGLTPLPKGGKPALDDKAWASVVEEINQVAMEIQSEQVQKEPAPAAKSSNPRAKSPKSAGSKPQPLAGAALTTDAPATNGPLRSRSFPASSQLALPNHTLIPIEEPEPATAEARATTPTYRQDYDQTQNGLHQIVFAILIWEPSQSTHELIANERRAIYRALLDEQHQCILGSSLLVPEGQSLQDCEITQVYASDNTVLLIEPQISPMSEWQEFYRNYDNEFLNKVLCYFPETEKTAPGSWKLDETLYWLERLNYYQEVEITNCHVRTKVLNFFQAKRLETYRKSYKSGRGR